ncbi:hypothetical protein [Paenibacillus sp. Soil787]
MPKTWDEFVAICEKLKGKGFTPLITPVQVTYGQHRSVIG